MKLPKKITIQSVPYRVKYFGNRRDLDTGWGESDKYVGRMLHDENEIRVLERPVEQAVWETIIHEVLHVIFINSAFEKILSEQKEEQLITCLAHAINDFLWANHILCESKKSQEGKNIGGQDGPDSQKGSGRS